MDWLLSQEPEAGRLSGDKYASFDLLLMATYCIITQKKDPTLTDSWVAPAFLSLALPLLLGVKVVATSSSVPLYNSDSDFRESAILDGPAGFWQLLGLPASLRIQDFSRAIERLLITYCLHLDSRSSGKDAHWQDLSKTVREVMTDVLNIFSLADEGLRRNKRDRPTDEQVQRYWQFAQRWVKGDSIMAEKMKSIERLVREYRQFYKVSVTDSSHAILLPLSKALEVILSAPQQLDDEELIWQGAGQIEDALDRQKVYHRPILLDKSVEYSLRQARELQAIHAFMTTCVSDLFGKMYRGDRALLQENRNRIKSGAEFAYRWLELQSKQQ
jgi:CRISPR-associated protein Csc3